MSPSSTSIDGDSRLSRWGARIGPARFYGLLAVVFVLIAGGVTLGVTEAQKVVVPNLVGLSVDQVSNSLLGSELRAHSETELPVNWLQSFTEIVHQSPESGARVFPGTQIVYEFVELETSVPDVTGKTVTESASILSARGLTGYAERAHLQLVFHDQVDIGVSEEADLGAINDALASLGIDVDLTSITAPIPLSSGAPTGSWVISAIAPSEGTKLAPGSEVALTVIAPLTTVPDLSGAESAQSALKQAGLVMGSIGVAEFSGTVPDGFPFDVDALARSWWDRDETSKLRARIGELSNLPIINQAPPTGAILRYPQAVAIEVKWPSTKVPSLIGMTPEQAANALNDAGLSASGGIGTGLVRKQSIAAGKVVPVGASVEFEASHSVTFRVTSSARSGLITWIAPNSFSVEQASGARLPWSKTWYMTSIPSSYELGNFNAQMDAWNGWIACEILIDGEVWESRRSTGAFTIVSCS